MQLISLIFGTSAFIASASAQAVFNTSTDSFVCPSTGGNFCAGTSLSNNIIIRCTGTVGQPGNCNDNLAGIPPGGLKTNALCYQSTPTSGDASCSLSGIAYPDTGSPFPIPNSTTKIYPTGTGSGATAAAFTSPIVAAMATLNNAPFPIVSVGNNVTGVGGVVLGSGTGTGQVVKPTAAFVGGAGRGGRGMGMVKVVVGAGVFAAAAAAAAAAVLL